MKKAEKNNHRKAWMWAAQLLVGATVGGAVIALLLFSVPGVLSLPPGQYALALAGAAAWLAAAAWLHIPLHEAGHLLGGLCSGYRFVSYRVGKTIWVRRGGRLVRGRYTVAGTGGQCLMAPPGTPDGPFPYVLYNAAGGLANLLVGAPLAAVGFLAAPSAARFFLAVFGVAGVASGVMNLLPLPGTDGGNLTLLHRSAGARRAFWVTLCANAFFTGGGAPRDLPDAWLEAPAPGADSEPLTLSVHALRAEKLLSSGCLAKAEALWRTLLQNCPQLLPAQQNELRCQLLLVSLLQYGPGPVEQAPYTPALQSYIRATACYPARQCLLYALAVLRDGDADAAWRAKGALSKMEGYPHPADLAQCRALMALADARAAQSGARPCPAQNVCPAAGAATKY